MTRDHFAKEMQSPNFAQSYEKSPGGRLEKKIESFLKRIKTRIKHERNSI